MKMIFAALLLMGFSANAGDKCLNLSGTDANGAMTSFTLCKVSTNELSPNGRSFSFKDANGSSAVKVYTKKRNENNCGQAEENGWGGNMNNCTVTTYSSSQASGNVAGVVGQYTIQFREVDGSVESVNVNGMVFNVVRNNEEYGQW